MLHQIPRPSYELIFMYVKQRVANLDAVNAPFIEQNIRYTYRYALEIASLSG